MYTYIHAVHKRTHIHISNIYTTHIYNNTLYILYNIYCIYLIYIIYIMYIIYIYICLCIYICIYASAVCKCNESRCDIFIWCSKMYSLVLLQARSLVVSDLCSETKGSGFESVCQLCARGQFSVLLARISVC